MKTLWINVRSVLGIMDINFRKFIFLIPVLFLGMPAEGIAGNITGTVINIDNGTPIENIHVYFLDALNADLLGSSTTGHTGKYNSGNIPDSGYRVYLGKGGFNDEYHGAGGTTDFCSASVVQVQSGNTTIANEDMVPNPLTVQAIVCCNPFAGTVLDASTLVPIEGVQVSLIRGTNGLFVMDATTDTDGFFMMQNNLGFPAPLKLRYADPSGAYFPEYHGAEDADSFCSGTTFYESVRNLVGYMDRIPPEEAIRAIVEELESFNLPNNVTNMLGTPLTRTVDLLADSNPNNDVAVCKQLSAFISRVDIQEKNGRLTEAEADELRQSTEATKVQLGC